MFNQVGPRQIKPWGFPGMNLGSEADTEGSGYGSQKWSGEVSSPSTRRRTISLGKPSSIRGSSDVTVISLTGRSATPDRSKKAPATPSQHLRIRASWDLSASLTNSLLSSLPSRSLARARSPNI